MQSACRDLLLECGLVCTLQSSRCRRRRWCFDSLKPSRRPRVVCKRVLSSRSWPNKITRSLSLWEIMLCWAVSGLMELPRHHITSHHITSHHITSHHITSHHITSHHITSHHITTQHNTTQHNTTQHNTTQHNTTQHNTTQHMIYQPEFGTCTINGISVRG